MLPLLHQWCVNAYEFWKPILHNNLCPQCVNVIWGVICGVKVLCLVRHIEKYYTSSSLCMILIHFCTVYWQTCPAYTGNILIFLLINFSVVYLCVHLNWPFTKPRLLTPLRQTISFVPKIALARNCCLNNTNTLKRWYSELSLWNWGHFFKRIF